MSQPVLVWFRNDLRLADHDALSAAAESGRAVIPVHVLDERPRDGLAHGAASRWWLHHSLEALDRSLRERGSRLVLARGEPAAALAALARQTGAGSLRYLRQYGPGDAASASRVHAAMREIGVETHEHRSSLLVEPHEIATRGGTPFRVFTPFHRAHEAIPRRSPVEAPLTLQSPDRWPDSVALGDLELLPRIDWAGGLRVSWQPGESGAHDALELFARERVAAYAERRDLPGVDGTSRLSPHLAFGEITPQQIVARLEDADGAASFVRELVWREFAHHLLAHEPSMLERPLDARFERMTWRDDERGLEAWRKGLTGYPIVDAGMRELWTTGWMHNRVRMIVGSFLVKDLLLPWQTGAAWFWETLVDAEAASNAMNWQWVAGCGADAAPFFRVFNPVTQGERFDRDAAYVRRWVPELAALPDAVIHHPWTVSPLELAAAGVTLGESYPEPIVDHAAARLRALDEFRTLRGSNQH